MPFNVYIFIKSKTKKKDTVEPPEKPEKTVRRALPPAPNKPFFTSFHDITG